MNGLFNTGTAVQTWLWRHCITSSGVTCLSPVRVPAEYRPTCRGYGITCYVLRGVATTQ
ncbi:MAG: hypothetical protein LUH15_13850 [Tannerellaceae bacterium]|nr:hypothetical protein [Tannerellaceae bacterium]